MCALQVAKWTLCLLWKLMEFTDVRAIMDAESVETLVSDLRMAWPTVRAPRNQDY